MTASLGGGGAKEAAVGAEAEADAEAEKWLLLLLLVLVLISAPRRARRGGARRGPVLRVFFLVFGCRGREVEQKVRERES